MTDEQFYQQCAAILGTTYDCQPFGSAYRTRWNNRKPGGGRFPDHGIIRLFGHHVQIALRAPIALHANIEGREKALEFLANSITHS